MFKQTIAAVFAALLTVSASAELTGNVYLQGSRFEVMPFDQLTAQAKQGSVEAQFFLANRYKDGLGVSKSEKSAFTWFMAAAKQGAAPAQLNVGQMYATGAGVSKDMTQARTWFEKAAKQGDNRAIYNLALLDERSQNLTDAYKWYDLATRDEMLSDQVKQRARGKIVTLAMRMSAADMQTARNRADSFMQDR